MRHTLGNKPWFGCTAALDSQTFRTVCDLAAFRQTTEIKRFEINRPEVAITRAVVKRSDKTSFKLLHFVVVDAAKRRDGSRLVSRPGFHQLKQSSSQLETSDSRTLAERTRNQSSILYAPYQRSSLRWMDSLTPANFN
jgi:hypothetical protein